MKGKNEVEVLIGGERYTICGDKSPEYLQQVATYINIKRDEVKKAFPSSLISAETKAVLTDINIADDYFTEKNRANELKSDLEAKDKELFEVKHDLVSAKSKIEELTKKVNELETELRLMKKNRR